MKLYKLALGDEQVDVNDIKDLITMINNTNIETVEIEKSDIRIIITKGKSSNNNIPSIERPASKEILDNHSYEVQSKDDCYIIKSPMVGTFYVSSSPEAAPFVKVGDRIEKGQIICIIEAMKIMNEIESDVSGEVVEILVNNEDVIEYGQALMKVRR